MTAISTTSFRMTGGRRAALVIGLPVCLALVGVTGLSLVADIGEGHYPVSYAVPAGARSLSVSVAGGQLTVRPTAAGQATLTGTARYSLARSKLTESTTGGGIKVGYQCPVPFGDCELDATVNVPGTLPVDANTAGGDVTVTGTAGQVTLTTDGGNVAADNTAGPLTLNTGGGDISAAGVSSPTVSVTTSGGNIQGTGVSSPLVRATSGGGNIEIGFTRVPRNVDVSTSGGNITLVLPPGGTEYNVTAHTDGGNVSDATIPKNTASGNVITATSGGGNITISQR